MSAPGEIFRTWADPTRTERLEDPSIRERAVHSTAILMAHQEFATRKRMRLAVAQEESAARILDELGFRMVSVGFVDRPGAVAPLEYAKITRILSLHRLGEGVLYFAATFVFLATPQTGPMPEQCASRESLSCSQLSERFLSLRFLPAKACPHRLPTILGGRGIQGCTV